jgi:hypothetical protein
MDIEDLLEESVGLGDLGILFSLFLALFSSAASRDYAFCAMNALATALPALQGMTYVILVP